LSPHNTLSPKNSPFLLHRNAQQTHHNSSSHPPKIFRQALTDYLLALVVLFLTVSPQSFVSRDILDAYMISTMPFRLNENMNPFNNDFTMAGEEEEHIACES
jgi:hypothetical protein